MACMFAPCAAGYLMRHTALKEWPYRVCACETYTFTTCGVGACRAAAVALPVPLLWLLQGYTLRKRLESSLRRLTASANAISAVAPSFYAARFRKYLSKVFV